MGEFQVYARISGTFSGETPEDAKKQAERVLSHVQELRHKGFEVVAVAVDPVDRQRKLATVESSESAENAMLLLQWLQQEVFSEEVRLSAPRKKSIQGPSGTISVQQYPLTLSVPARGRDAAIEAEGLLSEAPSIVTHDFDPEEDPETAKYWQARGIEKRRGAHMPVPEGAFGYGWRVKTSFPSEDIVSLESGQKRLVAEMERVIKHQLRGEVVAVKGKSHDEPDIDLGGPETGAKHVSRPEWRYDAEIRTDNETGELMLELSGLFTSPISPEEIHTVLSEKIGIRSILPKEVAETDPDEAPAAEPKPVAAPFAEKNDLSALLGSLLK